MKRLWLGSAILGITLLNFFQFPGHTWLQSDTQIYMPILEHMSDASVLQKDLIAEHPHVAFTLYDETAIALRKITGLDFRQVLQSEQFVFRAGNLGRLPDRYRAGARRSAGAHRRGGVLAGARPSRARRCSSSSMSQCRAGLPCRSFSGNRIDRAGVIWARAWRHPWPSCFIRRRLRRSGRSTSCWRSGHRNHW
jgi:hypothetical protein